MSWSVIENLKPNAGAQKVPPNHVMVRVRKGKAKSIAWRGIEVIISPETARKMGMIGDKSGVCLLLGAGNQAGKIGLTVNLQPSSFPARRLANGSYTFMLRESSAEGLFSLDFPSFTAKTEEYPPERNKPPVLMFAATPELLTVED